MPSDSGDRSTSENWFCTVATGADRERPVEQLDTVVREPGRADQPVAHEVVERAPRLLDGHRRILVVDLHEVELLDAEPAQAGLDVATHSSGRVVGVERAVAGAQRSAFREHEWSVGDAGERLGDDLLGASPAVHRRRVDPPHAGVDGGPHRGDGGVAILRTPPMRRRADAMRSARSRGRSGSATHR